VDALWPLCLRDATAHYLALHRLPVGEAMGASERVVLNLMPWQAAAGFATVWSLFGFGWFTGAMGDGPSRRGVALGVSFPSRGGPGG
jgi:uncharacterized protein YdiU (UPF0061 family)